MTGFATYPSLNGRHVLVTGGGSGIGEAIVEAFCRQGSVVSFIDIARDAGEGLVRRLAGAGLPAPAFHHGDLRDIPAVKQAIADLTTARGPIRVLVNNAANDDRHALDDVTPDYWDERFAINLRHQFFCAQAVWKDMAAAGGGSIVNLGSVSWMTGQGGMPAYTTAKSAVQGLTRSLARDLGPHNIRVNAVVPGWIMTPRQREKWLTPEAAAESLRLQCLKRELVPIDIARMVLFLAADDSTACTSQNYIVDGGRV